MNWFIDAKEARTLQRNYWIIDAEVDAIQIAILSAVQSNAGWVEVKNTPMTNSLDYYLVFNGDLDDPVKKDEMDTVIKHFEKLGYQIDRIQDISAVSSFKWIVRW